MKYSGEYTREISFPLGGIGTGSIGFDGGRLIDWEIFGRPSKGSYNGYTHFAIKTVKDEKPLTYILNGDFNRELMGQYMKKQFCGYGFGPLPQTMCGFPHFSKSEFIGEFPIATLKLHDDLFPADIRMTAFNPFIPSDEKNSSLPAAFFEIETENTSDIPLDFDIAFSVANPYDVSANEAYSDGTIRAVTLRNADECGKESTSYGDLTVATDCPSSYSQAYWYRGKWQDGIVMFMNEFTSGSGLSNRTYETNGSHDTSTLVARIKLGAHEKGSVRFVLSWNVPNACKYWGTDEEKKKTWKNYYATVFDSSRETAKYALSQFSELYRRTLAFKNALFSSSLPPVVIDAAASNLSVLKSPTVSRLEDGSFYCFEGVHEESGSCEGTCQHVWNYVYSLFFLFPKLERSIRDLEFKYSTEKSGKTAFRLKLPLGSEISPFRACLDGQMGSVIKFYGDWKISGNDDWLRENWDTIKKVVDYARSEENPDGWDRDGDGVLEGRQRHTLDMELFGPSSWLDGMYLAALKAASEMGKYLCDTEKAAEYEALFERGRKWTKNNLFGGKYFIQKINLRDRGITDRYGASDDYLNTETGEIKYQIGEGSSIDQLLAQWHADILGLGDIFDAEQVKIALPEMMKNNFIGRMRDFANPWRIFSLGDEAGTVICAYPDGVKKPKIPVPYCEETMTGFEYSFAGLLMSRGFISDGLKVAGAVRDRFDGKKRNPWNEFECGSNYVRSMASYALIPLLCGFEFDLPHGYIGFNPYIKSNFKSVWSVDGAYGTFETDADGKTAIIQIIEEEIFLSSLGVKFAEQVLSLKIDEKEVGFTFSDGIIGFKKVTITEKAEIKI